MPKEMNIIEKIKLWYDMDKATIQIVLSLIIIGLCSFAFSCYEQSQGEQQIDISMYTESAVIESIEYEKIFGYAPLDSTVPPVTGIKVNFSYQVNNQSFTGKQTFYKRGFKEIMNGINQKPETLEVRYKSNNPKESIITLKEFILK